MQRQFTDYKPLNAWKRLVGQNKKIATLNFQIKTERVD